jgi:hypothetical protein
MRLSNKESMQVWVELVKKIELQSILVLIITLLFGFLLLNNNNNFSTPAGILGSVSIAIGLLYTFGSFFSNQIRESYKDVISEYKAMIATLKSSNNFAQKQIKDTLADTKKIGRSGSSYTIAPTEGTKE